MGVVLFVAELGGGFGHVRRLLPVAEAAAAAGHRPVFVVSNPGEVAAFVSAAGLGLLQAPAAAERPRNLPPPGAVATSFADILGGAGFADPRTLRDLVAEWDALLAATRPAAIVCELAPFMNVAAFAGEIPVLALGHGFALPPPHLPRFPALWDGRPLFDEATLLENVAHVCASRGRRAPAALPELLAGSAHAVVGLGLLDPYASARRQATVGPPVIETRLADIGPQHDLFAYLLGDTPSTLGVLQVLAASGLSGRAYIRRGAEAHRAALAGSRITLLDQPEPIRRALNDARVVVHHGSMLMTEESLFAGRPQVVVPLYLEHLLTARALGGLGVAQIVRAARDPDDVRRAIASALADSDVAGRARTVAEALWRDSPPPADLPEALLRQVIPR